MELSWLVCLRWLECPPVDKKVEGSVPGQGIHLNCGFDPQLGCVGQGNQSMFLSHINEYFSLSLCVSASASASPSLSESNEKMPLGKDKKN